MTDSLKHVLEHILQTKGSIYLTSHFGPDHDSIASIALMVKLLELTIPNTKVIVLLDQEISKDSYTNYPLEFRDQIIAMSDKINLNMDDLLIILDAHELSRCLNHIENLGVEKYNYQNVLAIDHHEYNENSQIDNIFLDHDFSSATEIIYTLGLEAEKSGLIKNAAFTQNKMVAEMTQVGILADTDRGLYGLGPETYRVMYECHKIKPLNVERLYKGLLKVPFGAYQALSEMLPYVEMRDDCVFVIVDYEMEKDYMQRKDDLRAARAVFLEFLNRQTVGAEWSWIARERAPGKWRVSFRSLNDGPSVLEKVSKMGGGGVHSAGSCEILADSKEELVEKVFDL